MRTLSQLDGTDWSGSTELWLDPLGDEVQQSACTVSVSENSVRYTWSHESQPHEGSVTLGGDDAVFVDTWHQQEPMTCRPVLGSQALFQVQGSYGPDLDWGWRIGLSLRAPTGELVLQMTNIAPWGEEVRAVRMTCTRG